MKLPAEIKAITLNFDRFNSVYPPLGFVEFSEYQLGNGDVFGLYWPIGREDDDPIVAETYHDEWSIQPLFSSLDRFLAATAIPDSAGNDDGDGDFEEDDDGENDRPAQPTVAIDPRSPAACYRAAREALKAQQFDAAVALLETAVKVLPEFADAQALLCQQYRRLERLNDAVRAAVQTIISPPCFGDSAMQVAGWLGKQAECPAELAGDPVWNIRGELTMKFGGVKDNSQYERLREAIDQYLERGQFIPAMTLMQNYGERMSRETVSFQERHDFDPEDFFEWQCEVAESRYGKSRELKPPVP